MGEAGLPVAVWPHPVVRRPATAHQGARELGVRLPAPQRRVAGRLLQPAVLPHRYHATDGAQE